MTGSLRIRQVLTNVRLDESLGDRFGTVLAITLLPVPLVSLLYTVHSVLTDIQAGACSLPSSYLSSHSDGRR